MMCSFVKSDKRATKFMKTAIIYDPVMGMASIGQLQRWTL